MPIVGLFEGGDKMENKSKNYVVVDSEFHGGRICGTFNSQSQARDYVRLSDCSPACICGGKSVIAEDDYYAGQKYDRAGE